MVLHVLSNLEKELISYILLRTTSPYPNHNYMYKETTPVNKALLCKSALSWIMDHKKVR